MADAPEHGRDRNKRATRHALRTATLDLGLERSLDVVPIGEIARRAGVSTRTFFNYFDTKEDAALIELFGFSDEELHAFANSSGSAGAWADLTQLFTADVGRADVGALTRYLQLHAQNPHLAARQMAYYASFLDRLTTAVGTRLGAPRRNRLRAEVMAGSCLTAVRVGLDQWTARGGKKSAARHVAAAFAEFDGAFGDP